MNTNLNLQANSSLRSFLKSQLEDAEPGWWSKRVIRFLRHENQDRAWRMGPSYLRMMDLAETLKVLKGNWEDISCWNYLDRRTFGLICHLSHARNCSSHLSDKPKQKYEAYDQMALRILLSEIEEINSRNVA